MLLTGVASFIDARAAFRFRRSFGRLFVQEASHGADEEANLPGALGEHHVGAGGFLGQPERLNEAGKQNDRQIAMRFADVRDQLDSIHAGHPKIRDHQIDVMPRQHI